MKILCLLVIGLLGCGRNSTSANSPSVDTPTVEGAASDGVARKGSPIRVGHRGLKIIVRGWYVRNGEYIPYDVVGRDEETGVEYDLDPAVALDFDGTNYR